MGMYAKHNFDTESYYERTTVRVTECVKHVTTGTAVTQLLKPSE